MGQLIYSIVDSLISIVAGLYVFLRAPQVAKSLFKSENKIVLTLVRFVGIASLGYGIISGVKIF